ncbi:MAG: hypothetical protein Q4E12_01970 [Coriobacteriia bacterium]|nr:hypothetical protein [Coriobacteriia bacterium]
MKNFETRTAICGTSALKLDQQGSAAHAKGNVIAFPGSAPSQIPHGTVYQEIGYGEFLKSEFVDVARLLRTGTLRGRSAQNLPKSACLVFGGVVALVVLLAAVL